MIGDSEGEQRKIVTRRLGTQTLYVFLGNLFTLVVGLPLQIYVARVLGASGLGVYALIEAGIIMLTGFIGFGIASTLVRFVPPLLDERDFSGVRTLIVGGAIALTGIGILAYSLVVINLHWVSFFFPMLREYHDLVLLMSCLIPLSLLMFFFSTRSSLFSRCPLSNSWLFRSSTSYQSCCHNRRLYVGA